MSQATHRQLFGAFFVLVFGFVATCRADESKGIKWEQTPRLAAQSSKKSNRPVLIYVTASYCTYCRKLEKNTWTDATVAKLVNEEFVPLKVDGEHEQRLVTSLEIEGLPAVIVLSPEGEVLGRVEGYVSPKDMLARLKKSLAGQSGNASLPK